MTTPERLYLEIATMLDPSDPEDAKMTTENRSFRSAVDHAYQAGWRDHEQLPIDELNQLPGDAIPYPPEVYP